jgi:hypothetical protein
MRMQHLGGFRLACTTEEEGWTKTCLGRELDSLEVIAWELEKLRVLKEHELGVSREYDRDDGLYYVPNAEE